MKLLKQHSARVCVCVCKGVKVADYSSGGVSLIHTLSARGATVGYKNVYDQESSERNFVQTKLSHHVENQDNRWLAH